MAKRKSQKLPGTHTLGERSLDGSCPLSVSASTPPKRRARGTLVAPVSLPIVEWKTLSRPLQAKIQHFQRFCAQQDRESLIPRSNTHEGKLEVSSTALLAAVMTLCADWELADPMYVNVSDISEVIINTEHADIVTIDLSKTTSLEKSVHASLPGYGLEHISLLGFELEDYYCKLASMASDDNLRHGQ